MSSRVEGVYDTIEEANRKVEGLRDRGHPRHTVIAVVNEEIGKQISGDINATVDIRGESKSDDSDGSMWDSIKSAFTSDDPEDEVVTSDSDKDNDPAYGYKDDIKQGKIVILLREGARL